MSARRSHPEDLRVVRELARETAELGPPPIDWGGVERRIFERIASTYPRQERVASERGAAT